MDWNLKISGMRYAQMTQERPSVKDPERPLLTFWGRLYTGSIKLVDLNDAKQAKGLDDLAPRGGFWRMLYPSDAHEQLLTRLLLYRFVQPHALQSENAPLYDGDTLSLFYHVRNFVTPEDQNKFVYEIMADQTLRLTLSDVDDAPLTLTTEPSAPVRAITENFIRADEPAYEDIPALLVASKIVRRGDHGSETLDPIFMEANRWQKGVLSKLAAPSAYLAIAAALYPDRFTSRPPAQPEKSEAGKASIQDSQPGKPRSLELTERRQMEPAQDEEHKESEHIMRAKPGEQDEQGIRGKHADTMLLKAPPPKKSTFLQLAERRQGASTQLGERKASEQVVERTGGILGEVPKPEQASPPKSLKLQRQTDGTIIAHGKYSGRHGTIEAWFAVSLDKVACVRYEAS